MIMHRSKLSCVAGPKKPKEEYGVWGYFCNSSRLLTLINLPSGQTHNEWTPYRNAMFHPKWEYTSLPNCQTRIYRTPRFGRWFCTVWSSADAGCISWSAVLGFIHWLFLHRPLLDFIFVFQEVVRYSKKHIFEKEVRDILVYVLAIATLFATTEMYER